jgi:hypothetical protein
MLQPAKDGIGTDGIRFFAAIARMGTWVDGALTGGWGMPGPSAMCGRPPL